MNGALEESRSLVSTFVTIWGNYSERPSTIALSLFLLSLLSVASAWNQPIYGVERIDRPSESMTLISNKMWFISLDSHIFAVIEWSWQLLFEVSLFYISKVWLRIYGILRSLPFVVWCLANMNSIYTRVVYTQSFCTWPPVVTCDNVVTWWHTSTDYKLRSFGIPSSHRR